MKINDLIKIELNKSQQWLLVRGRSESAPLIIHVQAGPGLPIIPEANTMQKLLHLEDDFLVAYWDQRACGKSFNKNIDPKTINFSQSTDDLISCTKFLLEKYKKKKAILIGYSIGATTALMAASKEPALFGNLFLAGIDIDIPQANKYTLEFALQKAKELNKLKLVKQASDICKTSILTPKEFQKRARLITNLGGIKTGTSYNQLLQTSISNILFCKAYRFSDLFKTIRGMEFCQKAMLSELNTLNLLDKIKSIDVPVHFMQGKLDGVTPYQIAYKYYEFLQTDKKTFTSFENSAHMPHYEEPEKFANVLKENLMEEYRN